MRSKKVERTIRISKRSEEFLYLVQKKLNIRQITSFRKKSIQSSYKLLNRLLEKGLVRKLGSVIEVTEKGLKFLALSKKVEYHLVRVNHLRFRVKVLHPDNFFNKIPRTLILKKYNYKKIPLRNTEQYSFNYRNIKVIATSKSFIFCMPNIYAKTALEGFSQALDLLLDTIPSIENIFKVLLLKSNYAKIDILSQEYALTNNELAKKYRIEGDKLYVRDKKGLWLTIDYSLKVDELETVHKASALDDNETVQNFFNDLKTNPQTLTNIKTEYYKAFSALTKQITLHLSVVKEMKDLINTLNKKFKSER